MNKINRVILCVIDNLRSDHLFHFIEKGLMPNIKRLMEGGIYSKNCITDFPPITYPTQVSMLTGTYTGDYRKEHCHGVPLMNWMDRNFVPPSLRDYTAKNMQIYKLNSDIGDKCKTIYEMQGEENTASIGEFINRGANYFFPERKTKLAMYYLVLGVSRNRKKMMIRTDSAIVQKLIDVFKKPKRYFQNKDIPVISVLWFMTPDILLHFFGDNSQIYKLNILHIDKVLGVLIDNLKKMGYLDDTVIAVVSDHGNYKADRVGEMTGFFNKNNLIHYHPRKQLTGNIYVAKYDGVGFFNLKSNRNGGVRNHWYHPTIKEMENYGPKKVNLLQELFNIKSSHLMYYRDDNNSFHEGFIHLKKKFKDSGKIISGTIEYRGTGEDYKTKYIVNNDETDIFGYLEDEKASKLLDNKFHTIQEWLEVTHHLDYPLYPDLIPRHFKNPRSSDIILSNDGSVVFNIKNGKKGNDNVYNHDIGIRECMNVPLIIGGSSEIPKKQIVYCKTTDIVPTLLNMLGKKHHRSFVGQSLI
jgi:hypothetical protein